MMLLDRELETFRRELPELLKNHEGQFALIQGETIDSFWETEYEAVVAGDERFGLVPFLVKKVQKEERPLVVANAKAIPRCQQ